MANQHTKMTNQHIISQYKKKHINPDNNIREFSKKIMSNYTTHSDHSYNDIYIIPNSVKYVHLNNAIKYTYCCIPNSVKHISYHQICNLSVKNNLLFVKWISIKNLYYHKNIKKNTNIIFKYNIIYNDNNNIIYNDNSTYNKQNYFLMDNLQKIYIIVHNCVTYLFKICNATKNINDVQIILRSYLCTPKISIKMSSYINIYKNAYSLLIFNARVIYVNYHKNVYNLKIDICKSFIVEKQNTYATNYYVSCTVYSDYVDAKEIMYFSKFVCKFYLNQSCDSKYVNISFNIRDLNICFKIMDGKKIFIKNIDIFTFRGNEKFANNLLYISNYIKIVILDDTNILKRTSFNLCKYSHTLLLSDCDISNKSFCMFKNVKQLKIQCGTTDCIDNFQNLKNKQSLMYIHTLQIYKLLFANNGKYNIKTNAIYEQLK